MIFLTTGDQNTLHIRSKKIYRKETLTISFHATKPNDVPLHVLPPLKTQFSKIRLTENSAQVQNKG